MLPIFTRLSRDQLAGATGGGISGAGSVDSPTSYMDDFVQYKSGDRYPKVLLQSADERCAFISK
jgi:hypothetical protein